MKKRTVKRPVKPKNKPRFFALFMVVVMSLLTVSCGKGEKSASTRDTTVDTVYTPQYAGGFIIQQVPMGTVVSVNNPWQGAQNITNRLLIVSDEKSTEAVDAKYSGKAIHGPAQRIVAMSSTHVALLDALGVVDRVVGVSGRDYISNATIRKKGDAVADVGYGEAVDYERIMALNPDLVLLYGVDSASPMENKLRELGIPYLYIGEYLEESPLGKAEWLIALGEVTGRQQKARDYFNALAQRYNNLKHSAKKYRKNPAKVMINTPYGDVWYMPSSRSYSAQLINDAGGRLVYNKDTGTTSQPIDMEQAYSLAAQADYWINPGMFTSMKQLLDVCPKMAGVKAVKAGNVFNNNAKSTPTGGNDYYESGIVHPDLILKDLIQIFHPDGNPAQFTYYRPLAAE